MTPRVHAEWRNRVAAEYRSAALTAQTLHRAIQCGLPDELLRTAQRIVGDELDHALLSHDCLIALGGADAPAVLDVTALSEPERDGPLAALVDGVARDFCLGETFAVPLFAAMREGTTHPAPRAVLDRVLRDEAVHRAFGWDALDALLAIDPDGVRARLSGQWLGWLAGFRRSYGTLYAEQPLSDDEIACGLIPMTVYVDVHDRCVAEDIGPRLAKRGMPV